MRNQNGFGSIVCLDKTGKKRRKPYAVRITTGWKNGRQQRKYVGYYATQTEALIALAEYHKNGVSLDLSKLTLREVYDKWMVRVENRAEGMKLSDSAVKTHRMLGNRLETIGNVPMKNLKTDHLQDWMNEIDLKPSSKNKIKQTLSQVYEYAMINDIVTKNYASGVDVVGKIEKTGAVFTDLELAYLWDNADDETIQHILIAIYTGVRIGELLSITTDTINFEEGYMIGGSKTEAGKDRVIPIHPKIMTFIKEQTTNSKYIVHTRKGTSVTYSTAKERFNNLMKKLGWGHKWHDTRKTGISIMHSAGIPIETVRIIVGHSGKGVTESVYLYKSASELVEAVKTIEIPY